jgi:hypothetical protein
VTDEAAGGGKRDEDEFGLPGCLEGTFACVVLFGLPWIYLFVSLSLALGWGAGSDALPVVLAWLALLIGGVVLFARGLTREALSEHGLVFFAATIIVVAVGAFFG